MKNKDVIEVELEEGRYCRKGNPECFCKVGWPKERMCPDCGPDRKLGDDDSYCVCPPEGIVGD